MSDRLASVSAVVVVEDAPPAPEAIADLSAALAAYFTDSEIIIVANGVPNQTALVLKGLVAETPDTSCHFLTHRVDRDLARLLGMDNAISDYVLLATPTSDELGALDAMIEAIRTGFDVVIAESRSRTGDTGRLYRAFQALFCRLYNGLTGMHIVPDPSPLRLYSRPAALHVLSQPNGEMLLKSGTLGSGFPAKSIAGAYKASDHRRQRTFSDAWGKALRALVSASAAPIRVVTSVALVSSGLAVLYSFYIIGVYVLRPDVEAGWTTISLQISGMMFLISLMFALLAEYIVQIHAGTSLRRRHVVARELRSERTRRSSRLNVIDHEGHFQIGAPAESLVDPEHKGAAKIAGRAAISTTRNKAIP